MPLNLYFILLTLFPLIYTGPISRNSIPLEFNVEKLQSLNEQQLKAFIELREIPEYHTTSIDPEAYMKVEEIIRYHGYPVEVHTVITQDGYILTIQRIPHGKGKPGSEPRKPVLVQHGLLCSSASWVTNVPEKNLPYILADAGYDVWLGNIRGTLFGRNHTTLSPDKDIEFWRYSFDQMAKYDVPAVIDYMLNNTRYEQIYYVGHSMGTVMMFALLSTQPKYNDIVKTFFALAPAARPQHVTSPIRLLAPFSSHIHWLINFLGNGEFLPNSGLLKFLVNNLCTSSINSVCSNIIFVICGFNEEQLNVTRLPVHLHHTPAGTSAQTIAHFAQLIQFGAFQKYNYGDKQNMKEYGMMRPPQYDLKNIKSQVAIFWGENDLLATPSDVSWLATQIENLVLKYRVADKKFSHLDFLWAVDVKTLLYDKLVETMAKLWKD